MQPPPRLLVCSLCALLCAGVSLAAEPGPQQRILVGIDQAFPPHQWVDERGVPRGFDVDLIRAVAKEVGLTPEFQGGPWHEIRARLERGEIDVALGVVRTPERERSMDFSVPILDDPFAIFVREDSNIESIEDLAGASVAVQRSSVVDDLLLERVPTARPVRRDSPLEALMAVAEGDADAAIVRYLQGLYFIRDHGIQDVRSAGRPVSQVRERFAVPEGRAELLGQLNDGLYALRASDAYDRLYDEWFGVLEPRGVLETRAGRALMALTALAVVLLLAVLVWSRTLRRQIAARTRALHESEAAARELERQLLQAQKMEALGRLAGGVAHDFDNVLTTIIGNAGLALDRLEPDDPLARPLGAIRRAGQAGADLTRQLLAFARGESVRAQDIRWNDVLGEAQDMLQRLIGTQITLRFEAEGELWPIRLDPGQALQIVMNLVINARDAIPRTGNIAIRAANVPGRDGDQVCLSVEDDGVGMDPAVREHIFEPFFTTRPEGRGSGLGLSTVYGIVKRWGGRVEAESEPGAGSTFRVWLPRARGAPPDPPPAAPLEGASQRVLLVEEDPSVRELLGILLHSLGYEVTEVADAESAHDLLREKPGFGLLLTDLEINGSSGAELARRALAASPRTAVLFLAGRSGDLELPGGARVGFLPKPFSRESLEQALRELAGAGG